METLIERVDVWSASIADKTGGLSWLLKGMDEAGADEGTGRLRRPVP
jgi:hypothetical protein